MNDCFNDSLAELIQQPAKKEPIDYIQDGLIYCGLCHTKKQCRIEIMGKMRIVSCMCKCKSEAYDAAELDLKQKKRAAHIKQLRIQNIQDKKILNYTFDNAEPCEEIKKCQRYVERWEEMLRRNIGLLFFGEVGTGKTFAACCIANALIDRGIPVLVTSFPKIINSGWDKSNIIRQMHEFQLVVIDDFGTERENGYATETIYTVIDERYKSGKPLIITTNLTMEELRFPKGLDYKRINDRILELCTPICFRGMSRREKTRKEKLDLARQILSEP